MKVGLGLVKFIIFNRMGKGPGRLRVKGPPKKKQTRWKKGQSCVTNPTVKKHRQQAAKSRMVSPATNIAQASKSTLTTDALAKHDEHMVDEELAGDNESVGGETFKTFLSGVSDCSQPAFEKVKRFWQSQAASQKEVCAVLAAVTEVIREQGGKETETEYFGALMTAMETMDSEESITAVLFLLSLIIKRVPAPILKLKFPEVSKVLMGILATHASCSNAALVKSTLSCQSNLLRVQDAGAWTNSSTLNCYQGILSFTINSKPKVRKAAQNAVCAILKGSPFMQTPHAPSCHPAAQATSKFCIQQIEQHGGSGEAPATCHSLTLLEQIIVTFPKSCLKDSCETILKVMTLSNVIVSAVAMKALHSLFIRGTKAEEFPPDLNAKLINALYDFQPAANDSQPAQAWLAVMQAAHINLFRNDESLCLNHLHRLFQVSMSFLLSEKGEIAVASANVMKTLLQECVASTSSELSSLPKSQNQIVKIFQYVESGMSYRYHSSWGLVLQILGVFFEVWGKTGHQYMRKCMQTICDLRSTHHFAFISEVDECVGKAIKVMGPRVVLEAVPLEITGEEDNYDFPRSWLVPVIRDNVCNTELQFFTKYFLPLAANLKIKSLELKQNGREVEAKTYDVLQAQLWSLLPGFCKSPVDVVPAFKGIAKILGSALSDRPDVRPDVCAGLRNIIRSNLEDETNKTEIARFAKNFLPILFNIFTTESPEDRSILTILETIKVYLQIADMKLVEDLAFRVCGKFGSAEANQSPPLMDLMIALVPYASLEKLKQIFETVTPHFESKNHTLQKKAYRTLEEICAGQSDACSKFIAGHMKELEKKLVESMSSSSSPSKAPRLRCLLHIVKNLPPGKEEFLESVLPEVVMCTKEVNSKTRGTAFLLLSEIGRCFLRSEDGSKEENLSKYLSMLAAGLAGSQQMISASILAMTTVVFEFKDVLEGALLEQLISSLHILMESKSREIVRSCLGLVKVICSVIEDVSLAQFVKPLLDDIGNLLDANSRALRVTIKSIFKQLVKKFGFEMVSKMVAPKQMKMLQNVKKRQDRNKRLRAAKEALADDEDEDETMAALVPSKAKPESMEEILRETDSEDEEDGDEEKKQKVKGKRSKKATGRGSTWLKEDDKDEPIDFLDPSVSKRVLATKPTKEAGPYTGIKHDFKKLPDGRLVITEPNEEEGEGKATSGGKKRKLEPDDDLEAMMDQELSSRKKMKKKWDNIDSSDDEGDDEVSSRYQAGGGGIHRNVAAPKKPKALGEEYKAKKAGGDMKKKGKPDPYAYLPLSRQQLNRRKKKQTSGVWKGVAKTGHRKGLHGGQTGKKKGHSINRGQKNKKHKH